MTQVALVTGGNRGIGLGITRRLLADGYAVAILATAPSPPSCSTSSAPAGLTAVLPR